MAVERDVRGDETIMTMFLCNVTHTVLLSSFRIQLTAFGPAKYLSVDDI